MNKNSDEFKQFISYISKTGNVLGIMSQDDSENVEIFSGDGNSKIVSLNDVRKYHNRIILMYADIVMNTNQVEEPVEEDIN